MLRTRRPLAIAASALVALLLVSCGVDAGDGATTTTTAAPESSSDLSPEQREAIDRVRDLYVDMGMDPKDAECLAEGIGGAAGGLDPTDTGAIMDIVNECDIAMSELSGLGQDQGLDSVEDGIKLGLEATLKAEGLSEDEAACVADAFVEEFGSDIGAATDRDQMRPIFEDCDVDPSLIPGG